MSQSQRQRLVAAFVAFLAAVISVSVIVDQDGHGHKQTKIEFHVNQAKGDGAPTKALTVPVAPAHEVNVNAVDRSLHDETPKLAEQKAPGELTAAQRAAARIKAHNAPLPTAGASQGFAGCRTFFVQNQSSRNGVHPALIVLHYTVSHNVPGWSDVLAVVHFFDVHAVQASSNFIIDAEGNCAYIVPIENKAWAQAAANPYSVSFEVIDYGNEATYMTTPGYLKLAQVMLEVSKRTGIPLRPGVVNGCVPVKWGVVQHADFGLCGGGHHDINPFKVAQVLETVQAALGQPKPVTPRQRAACHRLNVIRRRAAKTGHWTPKGAANRIKAREKAHHLRCRVAKHPHLVRVA